MSDPTDPGGVGAAQAERGSRGTRIGDSGSPVGSPLTIILAVIAVVAGFLIFRSLDNGTGVGALPDPGGIDLTATTVAGGGALPTTPAGAGAGATTTTTAPRTVSGATIVVANASQVPGSAGRMTDTLTTAGYTTTDATDSSDDANEPYPKTIVYYSVGVSDALVQTLARDLGGATVQTMPDPIPVDGGSLGTATVLVMLGTDMADKSLAPALAPGVTAPAAVGAQTTTT